MESFEAKSMKFLILGDVYVVVPERQELMLKMIEKRDVDFVLQVALTFYEPMPKLRRKKKECT